MPVPPDDKVESDKKKSDKPKKEESNKKDSKKEEVITVDDDSISLEKKDENWLGAKYVVVDVEEEMLDEITALHKLRFPSEIPTDYYEKILKSKTPFLAALAPMEDKYLKGDDAPLQLVGFVASREKKVAEKKVWKAGKYEVESPEQKNLLITSIANFDDFDDASEEMLKDLVKEAKTKKYDTVLTHTREQHTDLRNMLKKAGFKETEDGKYKPVDGKEDIKYLYTHPISKQSKKIDPKKTKGTTSTVASSSTTVPKIPKPPKPKPKKGVFKIKRGSKKYASQILTIHNRSMQKERKVTYFNKLIDATNNLVWVAVDSNDDVVAYIAGRQERMKGLEKGPQDRINMVGLAVNEQWRGLGIAQKLWKVFRDSSLFIKEAKFVFGHVRESNFEASGLYKKLGFRRRRIGKYEDTGGYKYLITYKLRRINIRPYYLKYKGYFDGAFFLGLGYSLAEGIDLITED
jgi:ribosomal protein S18 acetylase RimI-like enzyme